MEDEPVCFCWNKLKITTISVGTGDLDQQKLALQPESDHRSIDEIWWKPMRTASYKTTAVCFVLERRLAHPCFWGMTIWFFATRFYKIVRYASILFALHQHGCFFDSGFFLKTGESSRRSSVVFWNTSFHRDWFPNGYHLGERTNTHHLGVKESEHSL